MIIFFTVTIKTLLSAILNLPSIFIFAQTIDKPIYMSKHEPVSEIKFNKFNSLLPVIVVIAVFGELTNLIRQGVLNHDYRWFILYFIVALYIFWRFVRITIYMIIGIPSVIITSKDITISEKGYSIDWNDIEGMDLNISTGRSTSYTLVIQLKDPWKYISQKWNPIIRYYCWFAKDYFYKPFTVNLNNVEGDSQDVFLMIEGYYRRYKKNAY